MLRHLWLAVILIGCSKSASSVQGEGPEAAAQAFGAAIIANDWAATARMMHPEAIQQLRGLFTPILQVPEAEGLGMQLFGTGSAAELAKMPDTVLFASFLRTVMSQQEGIAEALRGATFNTLGHVKAGGDTVLVVSRMSFNIEGVTMSQFEVMPFLYENGRWLGLLKADFTNMAEMMKRSFGAGS